MLASGLLCVGLAASLAWFFHSSAAPLVDVQKQYFLNPPVSVSAEALEKSRADFYGLSQLPKDDAFAAYRTVYHAANLLQFAEPSDAEMEEMSKEIALARNDALLKVPEIKQFVMIGEPIFEACNKELGMLLDDILEQRVSMDDALAPNLGPTYDLYMRNCGHAMPQLRKHELVTANGEWRRPQDGPLVFDVLQRMRFALQNADRIPQHLAVSPEDYRVWAQWRLMWPEAFSPSERYAGLARLQDNPPAGMNLDRIEAFIAASAGDWNRARKAFQRVCDDGAATAQDFQACSYLNSQHAPPAGPDEPEGAKSPAEKAAEAKVDK